MTWSEPGGPLVVRALLGLAGLIHRDVRCDTGLKDAIGAVLLGASWQRCRVHLMRNVLARVPKGNAEMVAAAIRTIFAQPAAEHVHAQCHVIAGMLGHQFPQVEAMLPEGTEDLLAFTAVPVGRWKMIWSIDPPERLNREIKRRTDVVGWGTSRSRRTSPTPPRCCAWPARCWSRRMTNGRSPTAATSLKAPRPCSTNPTRRWRKRH